MPYMGGMAQQGYIVPSNIPNLSLWYNGSASATTVNGVSTNNFSSAVVNGTRISSWIDLQGVAGPSNVNGGSGKRPVGRGTSGGPNSTSKGQRFSGLVVSKNLSVGVAGLATVKYHAVHVELGGVIGYGHCATVAHALSNAPVGTVPPYTQAGIRYHQRKSCDGC